MGMAQKNKSSRVLEQSPRFILGSAVARAFLLTWIITLDYVAGRIGPVGTATAHCRAKP